jgi:hypothetical protein
MTISIKEFCVNHTNEDIQPTFIFDRGRVTVDDQWWFDEDGKLSTLSPKTGYIRWDRKKKQYVENCHYTGDIPLGNLISIEVGRSVKSSEIKLKRMVTENVIDKIYKSIGVRPKGLFTRLIRGI